MTPTTAKEPAVANNSLWLLLAVATALSLGTLWLQRSNNPPDSRDQLPAALQDEPDLHVEDAIINQYRGDGSRKYLLKADTIRHFDARSQEPELTLMTEPDLKLATRAGSPWHATADHGEVRPNTEPKTDSAGVGQEVVILRDNVELQQERQLPRLLTIRTSKLWLYPDAEYVETDESVTIDTHTGRTTASAMHGDLATGTLTLFGELSTDATQQVKTIVLPFQFQ